MSVRRHIAGNMWCAQKRNHGKYPCLSCRGRGTVVYRDGTRRCCCGCNGTGWTDFKVWARAHRWIFSLWCAYGFDGYRKPVYNRSRENEGLCCPFDELERRRL